MKVIYITVTSGTDISVAFDHDNCNVCLYNSVGVIYIPALARKSFVLFFENISQAAGADQYFFVKYWVILTEVETIRRQTKSEDKGIKI